MAIMNASLSLRALARLLCYPDARVRADLAAIRAALHAERALPAARAAEIDALLDRMERVDSLEFEAEYVELFDRGRATSLHLFEHVHGDSRDRGPAMVDLMRTYEQGGLLLGPCELPDYLPVVLEFASTLPPRQAQTFLGETVHILNALFSALQQRQSPYASVIGAVIELAGEKASAVKIADDEPLDATWTEPAVFDGCSTRGQARPGDAQPMHFVRKPYPNSTPAQHGAAK